MGLKEKTIEINRQLTSLIEDSKNNLIINETITLTEDQATILQMIKIFVQTLDPNISQNEIVNMIFRSGLTYELNRMKESKNNIYSMGNLELLADENNIGLSDEEREVAAFDINASKTLDEYWALGYNTIRCPECSQQAVWHSQTFDYHCLQGCRKSGRREEPTNV